MTYQKNITDLIDEKIYGLEVQAQRGSEGIKQTRNLDQSQLGLLRARIDELKKLKAEIIRKYGEI